MNANSALETAECNLIGNMITGQEDGSCPGNQGVLSFDDIRPVMQVGTSSRWCYIYLHKQRIKSFMDFVKERGRFQSFVLRAKLRNKREMGCDDFFQPPRQLVIGGIVFIQGRPTELTEFFKENNLHCRLVYDCATHKPAEIPDGQMRPLRQVVEVASERLVFLPKPLRHYSQGHVKLRIVSGALAGLEGYLMRINRDRKLVMGVGKLTLAISGVHKENFVEASPVDDAPVNSISGRQLTYLQKEIDQNFFFPKSQEEIEHYAANVEAMIEKAFRLMARGKEKEILVTGILSFLMEEICYHFDKLMESQLYDLSRIKEVGEALVAAISQVTSPECYQLSEREKELLSAECDARLLEYGELFRKET